MNITELKGLSKGACMVIGHGERISEINFDLYIDVPKILINFYDPKIPCVFAVVCWDKDIMKDVYLSREDVVGKFPLIFYSGCEIEQKADIFLDPQTFVPSDKPVFTGARAIYLAQYLGYNEIYLVGFDFIPHTQTNYLVQRKEVELQKETDQDIPKSLKVQMDCFKHIRWIHSKVYQTNRDSIFKYFKYKSLEDLTNG